MKVKEALILTIIIGTASIGIFFFLVMDGYIFGFTEGIGLEYHSETNVEKVLSKYEGYGVTKITEKDLYHIPQIRDMLHVALEQELPLKKDGFVVRDWHMNNFWLNQAGDGLTISNSMSTLSVSYYENWMADNKFYSNIVEYKNRYFTFYSWIS